GGTVEVKNWTAIGRSGIGLLEISGGLWKNTTAGNFAIGTGTGGNNSGVVTVKGTGTLEVIGRTLAIRESFGTNSQGTLNLSESGVVKATTVDFGLTGGASVGTGTLNVTGGNLWTNTISKTGAGTTAVINLSGGTLGALDNNATWSVGMALTSGTTTIAARDFAGVARSITISGALSGAGSLTKTGNGTLTLSGTNTLTGNVTADTGTLTISGTHQSATSINANNGSTVNFSANNFFTANHSTAAAIARSITASNGGNLVFSSTTEARLGNIQLSGGTFTSNRGISGFDILLADVSTGAATVSVIGSSASAMNGSGGLHLLGLQNFDVADVTSSSTADLVVSLQLADSGTQGANTAGGINKTGAGTMSLTNANNNFTGDITVGAGTLEVGDAGRLNAGSYAGSVTNNGAL
ncbi:MAG TPA: hypothetical protein DCY41_05880, partial [Opitutae bacterium]|nr:hypothetical protein [Opitutae bacterium]